MDKNNYRSIPFWSWNDKLNIKELKKQIHWMKNSGIGGFIMHARSGLMTEYLSDEWHECVEECAEEGRALQMAPWIYDENGWPSGFVGGELLKEEANRDKYITYTEGEFDGNASVNYLISENNLTRVKCGEKGCHYLNLYIHTAVSTVDILNPKVVTQFLDLTHQDYKNRFGEGFAEKIEGFFTDEPQYHRWNTPYSSQLEEYWRNNFQTDILDELGLLFLEKEGYRQFRYRYWKAMQELMLRGFAQMVYEWCDEHQVKLTGHYIEETRLAFQMMCCGGVMPFYEYQHIPGIDWLEKWTNYELSAKQVSSVATQMGKKRVLTETFACCGWDITPTDLRRIAGFQFVNGVNMICQHLLPYSERGTRKYDYPAHYSDINPWVKEDFRTFNDYFTELGYLLGESEKHINVAMLHPIRSAYFDYKREDLYVGELDDQLERACKLLSSHGIDYHFLDETLLAKYGYVKDNQIGCGQCSYQYLILPYVQTMDRATERLVAEYVKNGGKLLILGEKPRYLEADPYDYEYLQSSVSLDEIMQAQPFRVKNYETEIYSTYRTIGGEPFLYIINASISQSYAQQYSFGEDVHSFRKVDLISKTEQIVPLEICLKPGEDALLYPITQEANEKELLTLHELKFEKAKVSVKENCLPIDKICYSYDGIEYSKPWPCAALFNKLIYEKYAGPIYLRYDFEVQEIPPRIYLKVEESNDISEWFNGQLLTEQDCVEVGYVKTYNISNCIVKGHNSYVAQIEWFQKEEVHFALFGENVTESLKNCLVYDTELQPVEVVGKFGVYPANGYCACDDERYIRGNDFYIGALPKYISEPSAEGFPFLSGELTMSQSVDLDTKNTLLRVLGDYQTAEVRVNGKLIEKLFFDKEIDISDSAVDGKNDIEVRFLLSNRNRLGPHHSNGDKNDGVGPWLFTMGTSWDEDKSEDYHDDYDIKKFY